MYVDLGIDIRHGTCLISMTWATWTWRNSYLARTVAVSIGGKCKMTYFMFVHIIH